MFMKLGRDEVLMARKCVKAFYQIRAGVDPRQGKKESKTKDFTLNAAILVAVLARYSKSESRAGKNR